MLKKENDAHTGTPQTTDSKTTGELLHILTSTHSQKELDNYLEAHTKPDDSLDFAGCFQHFLDLQRFSRQIKSAAMLCNQTTP